MRKMLSCNCLNVIIETERNDFQQVTTESLNLTKEEKEDIFFNQEIRQVNKVRRVVKEHSVLVLSRYIGSWILYQCLNCDVHTHAIHRNGSIGCALVYAKLLDGPTITTLRSSDLFSNIFHVLVSTEKEKGGDIILEQPEDLPPDVELALDTLKNRVFVSVNKETVATEERSKQYADEQFEVLKNFRDRAHKEHKALRRIILEKRYHSPSTTVELELSARLSNDDVPVMTANFNLLSDKTKNTTIMKTMSNSNIIPVKQTSAPITYNNSFTMDEEALFQLDEQDDGHPLSSSEHEDSENEVAETGRSEIGHIPIRSKNQPINMAKSLPVNIPAFMPPYRNRNLDEDHDEGLDGDEHPSDIAASIKALAKSVHGDTVFGDLPRPRFSTQI